MKRRRYTEEQIAFVLKGADSGMTAAEVTHNTGISKRTFYHWRRLYGSLGVAELDRVRQLEDENRKLRKQVADLTSRVRLLSRHYSSNSADIAYRLADIDMGENYGLFASAP